jgi:enoyl-CoA hydratase/carnithine racemase
MSDKVLYEVIDGVGVITLNRPEVHNALDDEAAHLYKDLLDRALNDDGVRAVLLQGRASRFVPAATPACWGTVHAMKATTTSCCATSKSGWR